MRNVEVKIIADNNEVVWAVNREGIYEATSKPGSHLPKIPESLVKAFKDSTKNPFFTYLRLP